MLPRPRPLLLFFSLSVALSSGAIGAFVFFFFLVLRPSLAGAPSRDREKTAPHFQENTHTHTLQQKSASVPRCVDRVSSISASRVLFRHVGPTWKLEAAQLSSRTARRRRFFFPPFRFCCQSLLPAGSRRFVDALRSNDDGAKNQKNKIKQKASGRDRPDDRWSVCVTLGLGLLTTDSLVVVLLFFFGQRPPRNEHKRRVSGGWRFSFIFFFARAPPPPPRTPSGQPDASTFVGRKRRDRK